MIPNPMREFFSTMAARRIKCLLMGGKVCVIPGAVEFRRVAELWVLAEPENLGRFRPAKN